MTNRRFNCCVFNHPCPIFCPFLGRCDMEVINPIPTADFGFFVNTATSTVLTQGIIPVNFVQGEGLAITPSSTTAGAVNLAAGTYEVTYLAEGTVPASGTMSIKLELNGLDVFGSVLTGTQTVGNVINLSQTMVITVAQNSTLELVNNSADTTTYSHASMFIRRI